MAGGILREDLDDANRRILGSNGNEITSETDGSKERLHVDTKISSFPTGGVNPKPGANYDIITQKADITIPVLASPAANIYTYSGSGRLWYFYGQTDTDKTYYSIWVDGVQITEFNTEVFKEFHDILESNNGNMFIGYEDGKRQTLLSFPLGLEFATEVTIKARADEGGVKKHKAYIVGIEKDS